MVALRKGAAAIQIHLNVAKRKCRGLVTTPLLFQEKVETPIFMGNVRINLLSIKFKEKMYRPVKYTRAVLQEPVRSIQQG